MRYLITSDLHGAPGPLEEILRFYDAHHFDALLLLGDILYYGPRNSIPPGMDCRRVVQLLNARADHIIAVRGNCDAEVDQMLLDFDIMADYTILADGGRRFFLTHGHHYHAQALPKGRYHAIIHGHTHLQGFTHAPDGTLIINPGSPTFPKGDGIPTFATLCDDVARIHHLDGTLLSSCTLSDSLPSTLTAR